MGAWVSSGAPALGTRPVVGEPFGMGDDALAWQDRATLLPPNATKAERAMEAVPARIDDIPASFRDLWNPRTCPINLLPWLAWAVSMDSWDASWPEHTKRARIAAMQAIEGCRA